MNTVEPADVQYDKKDFIITKLGNKISKKSVLCGSEKICVLGKTIIESRAVIRGDLAQVTVGKCSIIGEAVVLRAPDQLFKGGVVFIALTIGDHCVIERDTIVQAASVGNCVHIGKNCVIGKRCVIKDCCIIEDGTILAPGTVVPPFTVYGGVPGRLVGRVPHSYRIEWIEHTKAFYRHFVAKKK